MKALKIFISVCLVFVFCFSYLKTYAIIENEGNILKNSTITANGGHYNGWYEYYRPLTTLVDGNTYIGEGYNAGNMLATPYEANGTAFVNFKLENHIKLNNIKIYFVGYSAAKLNAVTDYVVDVKLIDGSWKRVAEKHNDGYDNWDAFVAELIFETVVTDEIRLTMINSKGQEYAAIYEVEAFCNKAIGRSDYTKSDSNDCTENAIPLPEVKNILSGIIPTTGTWDSWYAQYRPLKSLTDGNTYYGTGYNLGNTAAVPFSSDGVAYFNLAFDFVREINHIRLSLPGTSAVEIIDQPRDFVLDAKLQNGNWERIAEKHIDEYANWDALILDIYFKKVSAKELRITFSNANGQGYAVLYEMEAYYNNTVTEEMYTKFDASNGIAISQPLQFEKKSDLPILGLYGEKDKISYNNGKLDFGGEAFITFGNLYLKDFECNITVDGINSNLFVDVFETESVGVGKNRITINDSNVFWKNQKLGNYSGQICDIMIKSYENVITVILKNYQGDILFENTVVADDITAGNVFISADSSMSFKNISVLELDVNGKEYTPVIFETGDNTCDGFINSEDIVLLCNHLMENKKWIFDDINQDGKTNIVDVVRLKKQIAGVGNNTVYVANYGSDKASGSATQPLSSFEKALEMVEDGGVIEFFGENSIDSSFEWKQHNKSITITGDTLNFAGMNGTNLILGDSVTFDGITLIFDNNDYLFADGHSLCIGEDVVLNGVIRLYGGGVKDSVINGDTNIRVLSGTYEGIYGGSNNGTINGNTNVYVGGNVNSSITISHVEKYFVYGGGVGGTITGDTNVTFTDNAKAEVVIGGYNGWSNGRIYGNTNVLISGGQMMGVYGGNYFSYNWEQFDKNKTTEINSANITVTGGEIQQVFGGNANAFLTGDVNINILGGKITRRIYGGCYNNLSLGYTSSCYVKGNILLKISSGANISLDYDDDDRGIFAISRYKNKYSDEVSKIIFDDELAYEKYFSKIGPSASDRYMKQNLPSRYYDEIVKNY